MYPAAPPHPPPPATAQPNQIPSTLAIVVSTQPLKTHRSESSVLLPGRPDNFHPFLLLFGEKPLSSFAPALSKDSFACFVLPPSQKGEPWPVFSFVSSVFCSILHN